jgi:hypothetical protein
MRKRTIRSGLRLLLVALLMIIVASFYHSGVADLLSLSMAAEQRFYNLGIFWAAAVGGYGVMLAAFGLVLSPDHRRDADVRIAPLVLVILCVVGLFFYLLAASIVTPPEERIQPGSTITI